MKAWHFLQSDRRLRYGDRRIVKPGSTLRAKGDIELCRSGMHASKRLIDALEYAPGPVICRVDIRGEVVKGDHKVVGRDREVLWMIDATNVLHRFACRVAENALKRANVTDERCWNAISTKLKWLRGEATDQELAAAWAAAWAAARDAARDEHNRILTAMVVAEHRKQANGAKP